MGNNHSYVKAYDRKKEVAYDEFRISLYIQMVSKKGPIIEQYNKGISVSLKNKSPYLNYLSY